MTAIRSLLVLTLLTGVLYPLTVTAIAQWLFPRQANGSLTYRNGHPTGSSLIARPFDKPEYFWPRPSATTPTPYNAAASSGSNYGLASPQQQSAIAARRARFEDQDPIPADLLTASASGLDPDITPAGARYQAPRVAAIRHLPLDRIYALIEKQTQPRQFGILGEPRVNVAALNAALDTQ